MSVDWYYETKGSQCGPIDDLELKRLVNLGVIARSTLIWRQGMANWESALSARGDLFSAPPPLPKEQAFQPPPNRPVPAPLLRSLRFETEAPRSPASGMAQHTQPITPPPPVLKGVDGPAPSHLPSRLNHPLIPIRGTLIALAISIGAGILGSIGLAISNPPIFLIFCVVTSIAALIVMVRGGVLIYKGWEYLPLEYRSVPPWRTWLILIPFYGMYQIFVSAVGLSRQSNRAFKDRSQPEIAPEGLAKAMCITLVLGNLVAFVTPPLGLTFLLGLISNALSGMWIIGQARATNALNGHKIALEDFQRWRLGIAGAGGLAVMITVISCGLESDSSPGIMPSHATMPVDALGIGEGMDGNPITGNGKATWGMSPSQVSQVLRTPLVSDVSGSPLGPYTLGFCDLRVNSRASVNHAEIYFFSNNGLVAVGEDRFYAGAIQGVMDELIALYGMPTSENDLNNEVRQRWHWTRKDRSGVRLTISKVNQLERAEVVYYAPNTELAVVQSEEVSKRQIATFNELTYQMAKSRAQELTGTQGASRAARMALREFGVQESSPMGQRLLQELGLNK